MRSFLLLAGLCLMVTPAQAAPPHRHTALPIAHYRITDLGLAWDWGLPLNSARCLNNHGQIIARHDAGREDAPDDVPDGHTCLWKGGHWRDIGDLPPYHNVQGATLNDRGQVVGTLFKPQPDDTPGAIIGRGFFWGGRAVQRLPQLPPNTQSEATAINNDGDVVGYVFQVYMFSPDEAPPTRAFLYRHGHMLSLAGESSNAVDINDRGQIVGNDNNHTLLWEDGESTDLGKIGGPVAINDQRQVLIEFNDERGRLWQDDKVRDIGTLPGLSVITVKALNDAGEIVGQASGPGSGHAFLWQNGRMRDLSHIERGWHLEEADGINDRGQIVGVGTYRGDEHDFLLTPDGTQR